MGRIKQFQIFRYLKRWLPLIICFFVGMTLFSYRVMSGMQNYTASAVIEYTNTHAKEGYAPDGSAIDVSEVASSGNMAKVMENLGLQQSSYSLDRLCAGIKVEPIVEQQLLDIQEAVNKEGEEYNVQPTAYIVSCTLGSSGSEGLARDILNELLDVYFSDYSNKHINQEQINNETRELAGTDYDYLEMVERIERQLEETTNTLHIRFLRDQSFRSAATGCSFADLRDQFTLIKEVDIPRLYAVILGGKLTKDKGLLLNKYRNRIAEYGLTSQNAQEDINDLMRIINAYVDKMRVSGNTDIDYNYILSDVYDREWGQEENGNWVVPDRTVQYDELLRSWVTASDRMDYASIDAAYCAYIIDVYEGASAAPSDAAMEKAAQEISALLDKMNGLYEVVTKTNIEYNEYLGAKNIKMLSGASVQPRFKMSVYLTIIAAFFLLVGCCGAILLGRVGDILEYVFLRDRATGCLNRVSCDKYIQDREKQILPQGACCINIQIANQRELNEHFGREVTDQALREFGRVLRELFENRKNSFVGHNGGGQFWVFFETAAQETLVQEKERLAATLRDALPNIPVAYQMGAANAGEQSVFHIRGLISGAAKLRSPYLTGGAAGGKQETRNGAKQKPQTQEV